MAISPEKLTNETAARTGFTHSVTINHEDFTSTGNTQTFTVSVPALSAVGKALHVLVDDFDSSDATLVSIAYKVGDGSDDDRFLTSTEVCVDGTEVDLKAGALSNYFVYTSADTIDILFTGTAAKDLSTINAGKLKLFLQIVEHSELAA